MFLFVNVKVFQRSIAASTIGYTEPVNQEKESKGIGTNVGQWRGRGERPRKRQASVDAVCVARE